MWKRACRADEVPANGLKHVEVEGGPAVVVANAGHEFFACQAFCPHQAVSLANGMHDGSVLTCLEHMWQFDIRTGAALGAAELPLTLHKVKCEAGELYIWVAPQP